MLDAVKEQEMFLADFPLMTEHGTFIINGIERVITPQLARSFGIFFTLNELKGKNFFGAKVIPARGVWMEIESDTDGTIYAASTESESSRSHRSSASSVQRQMSRF
jgi:DNA-directed RNA polymerase subunit beta